METDAEANMGLTGAAAVAERSAKALGVQAGGISHTCSGGAGEGSLKRRHLKQGFKN